jgi:hypothetical protein
MQPHIVAKAGMMAAHALFTKSPEYYRIMERGGSLMSHDTKNYTQLLLKATEDRLNQDPTLKEKIAKALGYANPLKLMKLLSWISHQSAMGSHDLLMMQAVFEQTLKGKTLDEAIDYVNKYLPEFDLPSTMLGNETVSKVLRNPNFFMFSAYHFDVFKSYGNMARDFASSIRQGDVMGGLKALDKIAMCALLAVIVYPFMDKLANMIFGSDKKGKKAFVRRAGSSKLEKDVFDLFSHQTSFYQLYMRI